MLFSTRPKDNPKDLFGRDIELKKLEELILNGDFAAVEGMYGVGKTSLVRVALNELKDKVIPITLDISNLPPKKSRAIIEFRKQLILNSQFAVSSISTKTKASETYSIPEIVLDGDLESVETYLRLFKNLDKFAEENNRILVIFIDEFQNLNRLKINIPLLFKRIHDWNSNTVIVSSGGDRYKMEKILEKIESKTAFSGRSFERIVLGPFSEEKAKLFLMKGFEEEEVEVNEKVIDEAIKHIGTIPRHLVIFGRSYSYSRKFNAPFNMADCCSMITLSNAVSFYKLLKSISFGDIVVRVVLALEDLGRATLRDLEEYIKRVYKIDVSEDDFKRAIQFLVYDFYAEEDMLKHTYSLVNNELIRRSILMACERFLKNNLTNEENSSSRM